ncbi:bifunctional hydroxymethylpyrimidine kinase/phosphomethylpyrimidine kinase [Companilactobacillus ginsenosidimutans]|uniref:pyridoxal kinase n=1 Tax=Companilactobacillus ginsenosidimutans TaxID=1007676 RepID=A0A0H4QKG6_9LACO|nr:bifunctional hydroxymethylpyrimidine kinase/phosphomethylpyrimidine kinase [Companilactobacillus ginsenosidimutans]AKP67576.1 hydrogenase expression protein [Companilactobacillus ginsenosidimutans]
MENVLTIAGSDSLAGGGLQADLKTFEEFNVFGVSAITSVANIFPDDLRINVLNSNLVKEQLDSIFPQIPLNAVKAGLLGTVDNLNIVANELKKHQIPVVVDPVLAFKEGTSDNDPEYVEAVEKVLLPLATVTTPNISEAEQLSGVEITSNSDIELAAAKIQQFGVRNVLIKNGSQTGDDFLLTGENSQWIKGKKINSTTTNGAGCTLSAAITALLAKDKSILESITIAKSFVHDAIESGVPIGKNSGSVWQGATRLRGN